VQLDHLESGAGLEAYPDAATRGFRLRLLTD
jgi:hypothetical protein